MKTYIYTYLKGTQDANGNPRHWVTVYRIKRNQPIQLYADEEVGYAGIEQAVKKVIRKIEGLGKGEKEEQINIIRV